MRLATIRTPGGTEAVRVEDDHVVALGEPDVGALLARQDWRDRAAADGPASPATDLDFAPVVPRPEKIVCVGLNYRQHILEMGRTLPEYPTLFAERVAPMALSCLVDGERMQAASTGDLVFGPEELVDYLGAIMPLAPGDLIATGTPGRVGQARKPPVRLADGMVVTTRIDGIGECGNTCRAATP